MENPIQAIIFDLGGVILNLDYQLTIDSFKKIGVENFDSLYTQAQQNNIFDKLEIGAISNSEFRDYIYGHLGGDVAIGEIDNSWNAMLLNLPAERIALLQELKKKYKIYLYSNTNAIHYEAFREIIQKEFGNANLLEEVFHKTYYSHLINRRKPDASSFQFILDDLNLKANEVIFIDDSIQHVKGAASIGINAAHLIDGDIIKWCNENL